MSIAAIEDFLVATAKTVFQKHLKDIDHLPGEWGHDALRRMAMNAPCLYFAYLGGKPDEKRDGHERSVFQAYVFTAGGNEESQRRRGDVRALGAYQIVDLVQANFDRLEVPDADALKLTRTENLFDDFLHSSGLTGYRISFELLRALPQRPDQVALGDFLQLFTTYPTPEHAPTVSDESTLPQE